MSTFRDITGYPGPPVVGPLMQSEIGTRVSSTSRLKQVPVRRGDESAGGIQEERSRDEWRCQCLRNH